MRSLVTSARGGNGNGYGANLSFGPDGEFTGPYSSDPRIADPRGLSLDPSGALVYLNSGDDRMLALDLHRNVVRDSGPIPRLDPGGAEFGPDGRYYVTLRRQRTILAMPTALDGDGEYLLPEGIVAFPRGFGFRPRGRLYLASGAAPSGHGGNTIAVFDSSGTLRTPPPSHRPRTESPGPEARSKREHRSRQRMAVRRRRRPDERARVRPGHRTARARPHARALRRIP
jgi:DNA-binding beta-propeller fold protein YncE